MLMANLLGTFLVTTGSSSIASNAEFDVSLLI
jgi:hypothetical protein